MSDLGEAGWGADHSKMGKGVTLTKEELRPLFGRTLRELLNSMEL